MQSKVLNEVMERIFFEKLGLIIAEHHRAYLRMSY